MKAVFLCGGIGRRMFPLSGHKYLLKFLGKTLLEHQVGMAREAGLRQLVIVCGTGQASRIEQLLVPFPDLSVAIAVQNEPGGMADAMKAAAHLLDDEYLVINPNDILDQSAYTTLLDAAAESKDSHVLGYRVTRHFPGGYLVVGPSGELRDIVEKPLPGQEPSDVVNIVLHLHRRGRRFLELLDEVGGNPDDSYERALKALVNEGHKVGVVSFAGSWAAIKYPWHVLNAMERFLAQMKPEIAPSAQVSGKAVVEGPVVLGEGVRVMEYAVVRGPCYVGAGSVIGNNTLLRGGCHIGDACLVGFGTEVKHSYLGDGCQLHSNYVGDSVLGDGCSLGAGTITANLRLDQATVKVHVDGGRVDTGMSKLGVFMGAGCRTGVGVSLMPGVKVGPQCWIGPGVCLTQDLGPQRIAHARVEFRSVARKGRVEPCAE